MSTRYPRQPFAVELMVRSLLPKALPLAMVALAGPLPGQLDLPGATRAAPPGRRGDLAPGSEPAGLDLPEGADLAIRPADEVPPASISPARKIFGDLERNPGTGAVQRSVEGLLALGEEGLDEARLHLDGSRPAALLVAGHVCLTAGTAEDRAVVADRLTRTLPAEVGPQLLAELAQRDPVIVSPGYLVALLEHPTSAMRGAASRALEERLTPALLGPLGSVLESPRAATRLLALDLVAGCADPAARNLLLSRLGDASAEVAGRAAGLLAGDPLAEVPLLERAFEDGGPRSRAQAHALLALVRREEVSGSVALLPRHVEALRRSMESSIPAVAGAAAVALARIGHRSPSVDREGWLDREVPHWLVRYGTGAVFHSDFSALEAPCLRALALLSGQHFTTGTAARTWWAENASGFRARRGAIDVFPGAEAQLRVELEAGAGRWALVGLQVSGSTAPRELFLDEDQALRLLRRLEDRGLLGAEFPPTAPPSGDELFVEIRIGPDAKLFSYPPGSQPGWFTALLDELGERVDSLRWQLFHEPGVTQRAAWFERHEAFSDDLAPTERERAFKDLLLGLARQTPLTERAPFLAELERLFGRPGVVEGRDLVPCLALLEDVPSPDPQAGRWIELARLAAGALAREGTTGTGSSPARQVLERVLERFGDGAGEAAAALAGDLAPAERGSLCRDVRPAARAAAGRALCAALDDEERAQALELLGDGEALVVLGVLDELWKRPDERARTGIVALTGHEEPAVRARALAVLGRLGGEGVYDLALLGLADPDPLVQGAGAEALADLRDPRAASLLSSLLVRGPGSPFHEPARRGLLRLGEAGVEECLRLAGSTSARTRREAGLLLAAALRPEAARSLLTTLTEDPTDERVAWELAVLTGVDLRAAPDPPEAWWDWWDGVVHDDAWSWFLAAAERSGFRAPAEGRAPSALDASPEWELFLRAVVRSERAALSERALRELERRLGIEPREVPDEVRRAAVEARLEQLPGR
jgi:hypothetical protein